MVQLKKITYENFRDCLDLKVAEEQKDFVTSNMLSLAKAYVVYDEVTLFGVYNDDIMVGFMKLRFWEEINNYAIWQFMIDERFQSKGYGKQAMNLAIEWMKKDERCHAIILAYKEGNEHAKKLYTQLGFEQMGEVIDAEVEMNLNL